MHEVGVVLNIIRTVEQAAKKHNIAHVASVEVEIGELTGVVPVYVQNCWPVAAENTVCSKAELLIRKAKTIAQCQECGKLYNVTENLWDNVPVCPECESPHWVAVAGNKVEVINISVYD